MSIDITTTVEIKATIAFNEGELRALDALTGYGIKPFLEVFYNKLGKAYMRPYEKNLRELFIKINQTVPEAIKRVEAARKKLQGE
jgi:hypothetical protein